MGAAVFEILFFLAILLAALFIPIYLSVWNIKRFIRPRPQTGKDVRLEFVTLGVGYVCTYPLLPWNDWREALVEGNTFHAPVAIVDQQAAFILFTVLAAGSFFLLLLLRDKLPPLIKTLCLSGVYLGGIFCVVWIVQLSHNIYNPAAETDFQGETISGLFSGGGFYLTVLFATLFPINYLLSSVILIRRMVAEQCKQAPKVYRSPVLVYCQQLLWQSPKQPLIALLLLLPLYGICVLILTLLGQQPDAAIKLFTDTSDWLFSTRVSPPMLPHTGHYLCTVAARGHKGIVHPLRKGVRHGCVITVNRQLCVANAFEDLLSEHMPGFHRVVRRNYDKYGLPICQYIEKPWKSDLVYLFMKPAEWFFLIVLYAFDVHPEERIARQYLPPAHKG